MTSETSRIELSFEAEGTAGVSWNVQGGTLHEQLNSPYALQLNVATDSMDAEPVQMIGKPATLTITRGSAMRQVTGIVA